MSRTVSQARRAFLDFFRERDHEEVPSAPLVPRSDPTLLFTNAGMVPFKDAFTGRAPREKPRATSSQKCIRIAGKHNDFEAVGPSPRHHTFFEMLGNFSFGDYFKEAAIVYAWDFLTNVLGLDKSRLVCTVFRGEGGVAADDEARALWKKVSGFGDDRIIGLGAEDNFWQMGETGPCGPCSELHYYVGRDVDVGRFGQEQAPDGTGWMEIWNLVFMQYERESKNGQLVLTPLPRPCIDTGAGLERLSCVLQGKGSNYDVDLLRGLVEAAADCAKKPYGGTMAPDDVSMRVIADHARTTAFLIAEGVLPDRTGREYVLRRVMRRAVRHGHRLGIREPFLHRITERVVELMGPQYGELTARREHIASVTEQEESRFRQTIERGLGLLEDCFVEMREAAPPRIILDGAQAFHLYDTFGFPLDLTEVICRERGFTVDTAGYDAALEEARKRSEFKGQAQAVEAVYREALGRVPSGAVVFTGYDHDDGESEVLALLRGGELVETVSAGDDCELVVARTPFYAESGGQLGDTGVVESADARLAVTDTTRPIDGLVVHRAKVEAGTLRLGERVQLRIDVAKRDATRRNHSATHLLHLALRHELGPQAQQMGSLVGPERLRFDFTHSAALSDEQVRRIEDFANARIFANTPIRTELLTLAEAREQGAMMLFEEKYGERVRMLRIGDSLELCGGTHARATGELGLVKLTSQGSVGAGLRRITAVTGAGVLEHLRAVEATLDRVSQALRAGGGDPAEKADKLVQRQRQLEKQLAEAQRRASDGSGAAAAGTDALLAKARETGGVRVLAARTDITDRGALRELAEKLRDQLGSSVVLVGSVHEGKAQLVLTVAKPLVGRLHAGQLIRPSAERVGGSGGGRPDMAQAGGTHPDELDAALELLHASVAAATSG